MERLPNLNGLRAFEAAARHLSFTAAARELSVTQTAVSHQIRRLEDELGLKLFRRGGRAVRLSLTGERFLPAVQEAFELLRRGAAQLRRQQLAGPLTVSTTASFATKWLVPRLAGFQRRHPEIEVRIATSTALIDFRDDDVDVAIRYGEGAWPGPLVIERLLEDDVVPVCSPALLQGPRPLREPADLRHHVLLHVLAYRDDWRLWLTATGTTGVDPERGPLFDQTILALQAAAEGMGVALGRTVLMQHELAEGRLVMPFDVRTPSEYAYYLVMPQDAADSPRIAAFRDWLHAELAPAGNAAGPRDA